MLILSRFSFWRWLWRRRSRLASSLSLSLPEWWQCKYKYHRLIANLKYPIFTLWYRWECIKSNKIPNQITIHWLSWCSCPPIFRFLCLPRRTGLSSRSFSLHDANLILQLRIQKVEIWQCRNATASLVSRLLTILPRTLLSYLRILLWQIT